MGDLPNEKKEDTASFLWGVLGAADSMTGRKGRGSPRLTAVLIVGMLAIAVLTDFFSPSGAVDGILYLGAVVLAALVARPGTGLLVAWLSTAVAVAGCVTSIDGADYVAHLGNQCVRIAAIWGSLWLASTHRRTVLALKQREERFREITETAPGVFWVIDAKDFQVLYISPAFENIWGRSTEALMINPYDWSDAVHPEDAKRTRDAFFQLLENGFYDEEYRIVRPDGSIRWIHDRGAPVRDESGSPVRLVGIAEDITTRKNHEEAVAQYAERLEKANSDLETANRTARSASEAKSNFLANMSHEIRTPMTAILGVSDVLLEPDLPESERTSAVDTIHENGQHLLTLINDILDLSKIEAGMLEIERKDCRPAEVLESVTTLLAGRARERGLTFEWACDTAIPATFSCDPVRLRQILINLAGNAIKFTQRGGVRIGVALKDVILEFSVRDTGIGMSEEELVRLFQPFTQANGSTTREYGGTGLGLTISRRLARLHGGDIDVESVKGEGTVFFVRIPASDFDPALIQRVVPGESTRRVKKAAKALPILAGRVLVVEDNTTNQKLVDRILSRAGLEVTIANNGAEAVEMAEAARQDGVSYDGILMDMQMPVLDGLSATRRLRELGHTLPIVALTANAMASDRDDCLNAGCTGFATKPIERRKLLETLEALFNAATADSAASVH